ncbi:hypothetical protein B0A49_06910 [Cryomyces minteri]|uniref:Stress response RCI peptide n=1 Tax=Cryomyces minteri TaxID=331657 RepID=A0A4U0WP15_9PEZI|nr:hypothetical protein B0A49_06910 [Cryomyces minteri]
MCGSDIFLGIIAVLFPPIAVWVKRGICSADSLINLALCCLGFLPGLLHAWYIIASYPDPSYDYESVGQHDPEAGGVTYFVVAQGPPGSAQGAQRAQGSQSGYGTVAAPQNQFPGQQQSGTVNSFPQPKAQLKSKSAGRSERPRPEAGAGPSQGEEVPPSYQEAVKGDHKVQTQE